MPVRIGDQEGVYRITVILNGGRVAPTSTTTIIADGDIDEDEDKDKDDD